MALARIAVVALTVISGIIPGARRTLLSLLKDRFGFDGGVRLEAFDFDFVNVAFDQSFDVTQEVVFVDANQRYGFSGIAGSTGTADPVDIIFRYIGKFVIDDMR